MNRAALAALLLLVIVGCSAQPATPAPSQPTPAARLNQAAVDDPNARFLRLMGDSEVPYTGVSPQAEASLVCANLGAGLSREEAASLAPFEDPKDRRLWVDTATEVYCPELG